MSYKITIIDDRHSNYKEEHATLEPLNAEITEIKGADKAEIISAVEEADGVLVNLAPITAEIIGAMRKCKIIARYGVGFDNVDVNAATEKGIWVSNVTDYCVEDVSDQAIALLMSCVRKVAQRDKQVRNKIWAMDTTSPHRRIKGKNFVLFGYGGIARITHRKIAGFLPGRIMVYDPFVEAKTIEATGAEKVDWDTAIEQGDFFSLHMPLNDKTRGIFNESVFKRMKNTAILVNTSRGPLIDEEALYKALSEGWIDSAGLDVFGQEPVNPDNPLLTLDNITVSGHVGWYTEESTVDLKRGAAENIKATLEHGKPVNPVNNVKS